jgi:hypothetical protein
MKKRQTKKTRPGAFVLGATLLLLPLFGLATWHWMSKPIDTDDQLSRVLRDYGYSEVTPPSRLFGPGTITTVETLANGKVQLHLACRMNDGALAAMWRKSTTLSRRLVNDVKQTFDSSASAPELVTSHATGKRIHDIDVSLQDISVVTMPYEDLIAVRNEYLQGNCEEAVIWNLQAGALVCQPEEVLQADIVYRNDRQDGLEAAGKLQPAKRTAASAGVGQHVSETNEVRGDDLFLGVKIGITHCFQLAKNGERLAAGSF